MCSIMGYCAEDADHALFKECFDKTLSRGPDDSRIVDTGKGLLGFHRLAIMGLQPEGMQPFQLGHSYVVCNGEIYGFERIREALQAKGYTFESGSDCEILLPLYKEYGVEMFRMLDAEFALILYDGGTESYIAARDPIGIRPLYYGYDAAGTVVFASEPKNLVGLCGKIMPFPPGHYYKDGKFVCYRDITAVREVCRDDIETVCASIRASMGMYLVCRAIHRQTDIRVLLTGEISDELFGYKYTDFAPSAAEFQKEAVKRIRELHMYDVLRADRCISVNSLEARVPFGDLDFVEYVMSIDPELKLNKYGKGKYLLRHAFEGDYLPHDILYREKAAFSDAVGHSMVDYLKDYAEHRYTDSEFEEKRQAYAHARPFTKESLLYREIFETYYPGQSEMVADFWMPNRAWKGCDVNDPSARVLANYGDSGK